MHARLCAHDPAHLPRLEGVRGLLERALHLAGSEPAEIAALRVGAAVRVHLRELGELVRVAVNLRLEAAQDLFCVCLGARDGRLWTGEQKVDTGESAGGTSFQDEGLRLPECLMRRWLARTWPLGLAAEESKSAPGRDWTSTPSGGSQWPSLVSVLKK